jgi:hypothetical protein
MRGTNIIGMTAHCNDLTARGGDERGNTMRDEEMRAVDQE